MRKMWTDRAWDDYLYWQTQDRKTLRKLNDFVKNSDAIRQGFHRYSLIETVFCRYPLDQ